MPNESIINRTLASVATRSTLANRSTLLLQVTSATFREGSASPKDKISNPRIYAEGPEPDR